MSWSWKSAKTVFFLSLVLGWLPPFYLGWEYFNFNVIAKLLWLALIFYVFYKVVYKREKSIKMGGFLWMVLGFYLSQVLSVFNTFNLSAYLGRFEDLFFSVALAFLAWSFLEKIEDYKKVFKVVFWVSMGKLFLQLGIYVFPEFFKAVYEKTLHYGYYELIKMNLRRQRIYLESYDEILVPVVFYLAFWTGELKYYIWVILESFLVFVANFRTRFLMYFLGILGLMVLGWERIKKVLLVLVGVGFLLFSLYSLFSRSKSFTIVDRLLLKDRLEDVQTIEGRVVRFGLAIEMGEREPVLGVGLGNYYDYLPLSKKRTYSISEVVRTEFELASFDPHNIAAKVWAETGFLGVLGFGMMVGYFLFVDLRLLVERRRGEMGWAFGSYILLVYAFLNPAVTMTFWSYFFILRVLVEKGYSIEEMV